jgi:hypothetical protein
MIHLVPGNFGRYIGRPESLFLFWSGRGIQIYLALIISYIPYVSVSPPNSRLAPSIDSSKSDPTQTSPRRRMARSMCIRCQRVLFIVYLDYTHIDGYIVIDGVAPPQHNAASSSGYVQRGKLLRAFRTRLIITKINSVKLMAYQTMPMSLYAPSASLYIIIFSFSKCICHFPLSINRVHLYYGR